MSVDDLFSRFANLSDSFTFLPGYEDAIRYNLAIRLCPRNGIAVTAEMQDLARSSKAIIKRANLTYDAMECDPAIPTAGNAANAAWILTGGY